MVDIRASQYFSRWLATTQRFVFCWDGSRTCSNICHWRLIYRSTGSSDCRAPERPHRTIEEQRATKQSGSERVDAHAATSGAFAAQVCRHTPRRRLNDFGPFVHRAICFPCSLLLLYFPACNSFVEYSLLSSSDRGFTFHTTHDACR